MSTLKTVMQTLIKGMKRLTQEAEKMAKLVDKLEAQAQKETKGRARSKARPRPPRKASAGRPAQQKRAAKDRPTRVRKPSAIVVVMEVIEQSKKGVTTAEIREKTGFSERKIWDNVNRLKRQGKVKSAERGIYISA